MTDETPPSLLHKTEEDLYALALAEIQDVKQRSGIWAKALSYSMGDTKKAEAEYIRIRAKQLIHARDQYARLREEKINFHCPQCNKPRYLTKGEVLDCTEYDNRKVKCPDCQSLFDIHEILSEKDLNIHTPPPKDQTILSSNRSLMNAARNALSNKWGKAALACFIYLLISVPLQLIPGFGIAVQIFITGPFMLGWALYGLKLARGDSPDIQDMFSGFNEYGKSLGAYLLITIYVLLWSLLLIVPGIMALYSYAMTYFIMADNPDIKVNDAIQTSRHLMYGKRWKYFCLSMRYFGWMVLVTLTFGIGMIWLWPYMQTAFAEFYEDIQNS